MTRTANRILQVTLAIGAGLCVLVANDRASLTDPDTLVTQAQARVGRPLTPMSYAGVARRTTRRTVYGAAAVGVPGPPPTGRLLRGGSCVLSGRRRLRAAFTPHARCMVAESDRARSATDIGTRQAPGKQGRLATTREVGTFLSLIQLMLRAGDTCALRRHTLRGLQPVENIGDGNCLSALFLSFFL